MPKSGSKILHLLILDGIILMIMVHGLCHVCFTSGVEILISKGRILCQDCLNKINAKN